MKKVVIISSSPQKQSNSGLLAEEGGVLNANGCHVPGSVHGTKWMEAAFEMGKAV